ncbi:hypothetical protein NEOLEDRAFT_527324 [Neolentinus lepideus HHB14362 ss-1]|uniref:Uncharacterized protein n=1 Tax=Neolentinus lepideus HHB14362 ss-1 TaxID=1314782 RepID=A0A165RDN4_9AGAM|nr:hypothetical protein NEOLEDRAFT_527324 [Neolentinus lepideus HHB14362 ss-1]
MSFLPLWTARPPIPDTAYEAPFSRRLILARRVSLSSVHCAIASVMSFGIMYYTAIPSHYVQPSLVIFALLLWQYHPLLQDGAARSMPGSCHRTRSRKVATPPGLLDICALGTQRRPFVLSCVVDDRRRQGQL